MLASRPSRGSLQVVARESRIGSKPIVLPKGVSVTLDGVTMKVKVREVEAGGGDRMRLAWAVSESRHWILILIIISGPQGRAREDLSATSKARAGEDNATPRTRLALICVHYRQMESLRSARQRRRDWRCANTASHGHSHTTWSWESRKVSQRSWS